MADGRFTESKFLKIAKITYDNVPVGLWLVVFYPIECKETDKLIEVAFIISEVTSQNYLQLDRDVRDKHLEWNNNKLDCSSEDVICHDFRSRLFSSEKEASTYARQLVKRWRELKDNKQQFCLY